MELAWRSKVLGKRWEEQVETECIRRSIGFTKIMDGCKVTNATHTTRIKAPFQAVLHFDGLSAFLDFKRKVETFSKELIKAAQGGIAGNLCNLNGDIIFFNCDQSKIKIGILGNFDPRLIFK